MNHVFNLAGILEADHPKSREAMFTVVPLAVYS